MVRNFCFILLCLCPAIALSQGTSAQERDSYLLSTTYFEKLVDSSNTYYLDGDYKASLGVNIELLKNALISNKTAYIYKGYRHLGYDYMALNDSILALESFKKAEKFAQVAKNDTAMAITYMDLANINSNLYNKTDVALEYHNKSIRAFEALRDSSYLAKAHYNKIITALEAKEYNQAFLSLVKVKKLVKHDPHPAFRITVEALYGQYYLEKENYEMADIYLNRAMKWAEEGNYTAELENIYYDFSESLAGQGKFEESLELRKKYEDHFEKNLLKMTSAEVEAMSAKFQVNEYRRGIMEAELQNKLQAEKVRSKSLLNKILIATSIGVISLLVVLWMAFRRRKQLVLLLKDKNQAYLQAKEQSEKYATAKSNFFSTVSHELRTPLYGVIGLSTILMENDELKAHEKDLKSLKFSADYLLALINDVLQINKIDSNNMEDSHSAFNLKELLETIVSSFEYMKIQNKNLIKIYVDPTIPTMISGNPLRLSQILMNLIGNAVKFTENGVIQVSARAHQVSENHVDVQFDIADNGIGIAKEKITTIFEEFSQAASQEYNYQGTGLGLPIVKKLLALSNSDLEVESELGKGSTFRFSLVYGIADAKEAPKEDASTLIDITILEEKQILIVEDNRINQIVTQKILEKEGVVCTIADNGQKAVDMVKSKKFDLVLMDINMPIMDGIQATASIREFDEFLPIIALTAVEIEEMRHKIYQSGMNDIIVKPYDVNQFIQTILKNLRHRENKNHLQAI
ncbi:response regulator [Aureisphaera galaxeae]|uniref:response regulator n=1 Tax=Aureisphaera galaxeae TaxID=1538023 RepID=UPI00234FFE21|nr:response regulator [Aureisphaera galaxeae]MDC8002633.1 response regulator [Aureisphaera galaxeae]